jgi:vacuolar-type H+-ATPase subunit I/STV1
MNAPFTPVHNPYDDVSHLLAIMADPEGYRQRLQELIAQEKKTADRIAELNAMQADTLRLHQTAQATNIVADRRITALDAKEAELDERLQKLETAEVKASAASMRAQQSAVEAGALANKREAERLATVRKDYEAKVAKLNAAMER